MALFNYIEGFLIHLEKNEEKVGAYPNHIIVPMFPFFNLLYCVNLKTVIKEIYFLESSSNGIIIRYNNYISIAIDDVDVERRQLSISLVRLLDMMVIR